MPVVDNPGTHYALIDLVFHWSGIFGIRQTVQIIQTYPIHERSLLTQIRGLQGTVENPKAWYTYVYDSKLFASLLVKCWESSINVYNTN